MSARVDIQTNSSGVEAWISEEPQRQQEATQLFQEEGSFLVMEEMRNQVPIKTGFLRESITRTFTPDGFLVYPTAPYAPFVDKGTAPHMIFPTSGKVLSWTNPSGAQIFARYVRHPGSRGRFFIANTFFAVKDRLFELMRNILGRVYQ